MPTQGHAPDHDAAARPLGGADIPSGLRVMADYDCWPIWNAELEEPYNIDPRALPLSAGLATDLLAWQARYDATLNREDPARSGFPTDADRRAFVAEGERLARELQRELGPGHAVSYFDATSIADQ